MTRIEVLNAAFLDHVQPGGRGIDQHVAAVHRDLRARQQVDVHLRSDAAGDRAEGGRVSGKGVDSPAAAAKMPAKAMEYRRL